MWLKPSERGPWHEDIRRDLQDDPNKKPSCQDILGEHKLPLYPRKRSEDLGPDHEQHEQEAVYLNAIADGS